MKCNKTFILDLSSAGPEAFLSHMDARLVPGGFFCKAGYHVWRCTSGCDILIDCTVLLYYEERRARRHIRPALLVAGVRQNTARRQRHNQGESWDIAILTSLISDVAGPYSTTSTDNPGLHRPSYRFHILCLLLSSEEVGREGSVESLEPTVQ